MKWANFLHVYQPAEQQKDILEAVVEQSYRPLFKYFKENKDVRLTLNINASLVELFDKHGYKDLIDMLRDAGSDGRVEFTSSAKYHAFLPFLDSDDIERQIQINDETNKFYLGDSYNPKGFFPPEMAYTDKLVPILEERGMSWIILDEIAFNGKPGNVDYTKFYKVKDSNLKVFFKERIVTNVLMSAVARSADSILEVIGDDIKTDKYLITGMDGETFGHHRPGLENALFEILSSSKFDFHTISGLLSDEREVVDFEPVPCTWASSQSDIEKGIQYLSWSDPENDIHKMQWKLLKMAVELMLNMDKNRPEYEHVRERMDIATASDHFWWASAKPWWSLEMIEDGAYKLMEVVRAIPDVPKNILIEASGLYEGIVSTAFSWQRSGKIREMMKDQYSKAKIPFKDRTVGVGGEEEGVYHAFIDMMTDLEKSAIARGEYEKAILWRDAKYKLENKLDVYDAVHAVDLLRINIPHQDVEKTIKKYKENYKSIRGGQPEQRG